MPRYEFCCKNCGPFERWRSFNEASIPMICPVCQSVARRVYTTPGLVKTPPALARQLYKAEKSAFEPDVIKREYPVAEEGERPPIVVQSHGRPWQIGHGH